MSNTTLVIKLKVKMCPTVSACVLQDSSDKIKNPTHVVISKQNLYKTCSENVSKTRYRPFIYCFLNSFHESLYQFRNHSVRSYAY